MAYIGTSPSNGVRRVLTYTATANQTTFTGTSSENITLSYSDGTYVDVYQNGVLLGTADYTATSGTSIVLAQGASVNDIIVIIVYDVFSVADTVSKADGGTFDGNVTMAGTLGVTGNSTVGGTLGVTGETTLQTHLNMGDGDIIKLGDGSDLQLFHDASNSYIKEDGTGSLLIWSTGTEVKFLGGSGAETMLDLNVDGSVDLYHDNTKKLETAAAGITVTGYSHQTAPVVTIIYQNATTSIPDNTVTNIPMQASALDTHSLYDATNDRILIPAAFNGNYFLFRWAVTITGPGDNMSGFLAKNGSIIQADRKYYTGDEGESITFHGVYFATVATNDYFQVFGFSDKSSGDSVSVAGLENSHIFATKLH